jgi:hypothetical protein
MDTTKFYSYKKSLFFNIAFKGLFFSLFIIFNPSYSATITSFQSGNWSVGSTWVGGSVPGSGDDVVIANGHTVTVDGDYTCLSVTILTGGTNTTLIIGGTNTLNVTGSITIQNATTNGVNKTVNVGAGTITCASVTMNATTADSRDGIIIISTGTMTVTGNITMASSAARHHIDFTSNGNLYIGGNLIQGGLSQTAGSGSTVYFNAAGDQTITPNAANGYSFYNLRIQNSGTKSLGQAISTRNLSIEGSATLNCNQYTITGNVAGTMTMEAGTTLIIGNPAVATANIFPANYTNANITLDVASTVVYTANANQNVSGVPTYGNLTISTGNAARTKTLLAATVINGNLNITGTTAVATLNLAGQNITVNGVTNINANGTLTDNNTAGTNIFVGLVTIANTGTFNNTNNPPYEFRGGITNNGTFTKSGTGITTFSTNIQELGGSNVITFNGGDIVISNPAKVFVTNTNGISFSGTNFTNNSNADTAFYATSGTFTFALNGAQNINGTGSGLLSFYNLTCAGGNTKTANLVFNTNNDLTINTGVTLTLNAAGTYNFTGNAAINGTGIFNLGTPATTVNIGGSLTVNGTLNYGNTTAQNLSVNSNLSGTGTINMTGAGLAHNLYLGGVNNTITAFNTTAGSGSTVIYNRNGDQQVFGSVNYLNLTITNGGTKTLQNNVTVNNILNLDNGVISLGSAAYNLTIADGGQITGSFDSNHMIRCDGTGYLRVNSTTAAGFVRIYPVGTNGYYSPMEITALTATAPAYITVRAVEGRAPNTNPTDLNKHWILTSSLGTISANVSFTYNDPGEVLGDQTKYAPARSTTPAVTWVTPAGPTPDGANPFGSVGTTVLTGTWTARENQKTLYSYQTGNWNVATTWTTDPSGTLSVSPSVPTASDRVVILNGRTVTVTNNGNTVYSITINNGGILDLGSTNGHNFGSISGQGLIRLSSANMPGGTYDNFVAAGGGTVEYYNSSSFTFSQLVYNNLILNLNTSALIATLTGDMTINGNLTITQGRFQINDATAVARNVTIGGNVYVAANGSIRIGTGNARHRITVRGNFENYGSVRFTNQATPNYTAYPANGYADVVFDNSNADQNLVCNGQSDFYRIEINKGVDQTYVLNIDANATGNFALYGRNNLQYYWPENIGETPGSLTNGNALGLLAGTVRIGNNINIPCLATDNGNYGVYTIDLDAGLWIDNGSITYNPAGQWFGPIVYGTIKITGAGTFDGTNAQNGLVLRGTGLIDMQGGTMTFPVIRVSSRDELSTQRGAYRQSGGTVNITGNTGIGNMASFCLPYPGMGFMMSGGTLNILSSTSAAGNGQNFSVIIASAPENINVTGGTVNITIPNGGGRAAYINSSAPFYNLNINSTNANNAQLQNYAGSGAGPVIPPITAPPLVILNDFTLNGTSRFVANNLNVTVGHNFNITTNAIYTPGTNTTVFNGTGAQSFDVSGTINGNLQNMTLTNTSDLTLYGNNITILGNLTIGSGCILRDNGRTVSVQGNISNSGTHFKPVSGAGSIVLTGTNAQVLSGDGNGIFNNISLNKTGGSVTTSANFTITGELRLSNTAARLNIGNYNLHLTSDADIYDNISGTGKSFNNTRMIVTNGLSSDNGVSKDYNSTSAFLFPFGINIGGTYYYMPASIQFSSAPTTYGTVTTRPVNGRHPLATGTNNAITCYWKTTSTGFAGIPANSVRHLYYYDAAGSNYFVVGTESSYIPGAYLGGSSWSYIFNTALVNDATNEISYNTASAADGEFTAGELTAFGSIPTLYSSSTPGNWNNANSWSNTAVGDPGGAGTPSSGTIVIIGDDTHNHTITVSANGATCGSLYIAPGSTLDIGTTNGHNFAALPDKGVTGGGTLRIASNNYFPAGDFGDFIGENGGTVEYYTTTVNITLPTTSASGLALTTYKNLKLTHSGAFTITMPNQNITVYGDMTIAATGTPTGSARLNTTATSRTLTVNGNLNVNSGIFEFRNGSAQTLNILGNVAIASGATFQVMNNAGFTHTLQIYGDLTNNGTFDMSNGTGYVNTYFKGTNNATISGSGATFEFYRFYVDKGTNTTPVLRLTSPITVTPLTGQLVYLLNGTFRIDNSALTITLTAATNNFDVPSTACLSVNAGTCRVAYNSGGGAGAADLTISGKLEILGGTMYIGNNADNTANDIEYAAGGTPIIDVRGGSLIVNGQIRRSTTISTGSLNYYQSGGNVTVYGKNQVATRAKLEILNTGSVFNMSGGTITLINAGGTSFGDLYLVPGSYSVTGGTLQFGDNTSATGQTFNLFAYCPIYDLSIGTSTANQNLQLNVYNTTISDNLTINGNSQFMANGLNVTIKGNLYNYNPDASNGIDVGGYQAGSSTQTTTFNGSTQTIQGSGTNLTNFANLVISPSTSVSLAANTRLRVNENLNVLSGTFNTLANNIFLIGDIYNSAEITNSTTSGGINFVGISQQEITGDGNGIFGNIIINNSNGVYMKDNSTINGRLTFTNGRLYIDDYLLTLGENSSIGGAPNANRMIMLNGALSDQGVKKLFPAGASAAFTIPIGVAGKYTPAIYTVNATSNPGSITIRPVNSRHPSLTDATGNELAYYWSVDSSGFGSDLDISYRFRYMNADVSGTEASYVIGKYNYKNYNWTNLGNTPPYSINTANDTIIILNANFISGDFTIGAPGNFGVVIPLYSRNNRPDNNWSAATSWTTNSDGTDCSGPYCSGGYSLTAPLGNPVIIRPGHTILLDINSATAVSVEVNGELNCGTTVYHSLGKVFGTGKITVISTTAGIFVFPGGDFDEFFETTGTTVEFTGNNTATLPLKPGNFYKPYQNVIFSGTGRKDITYENIKVLGNLTIQGTSTVLYNGSYNKDVYVLGNWTDNNTSSIGGFVPGTGNAYFQGTTPQTITVTNGAAVEQFYNLRINNSNGVTLAGGGQAMVTHYLYLTSGNIITNNTNILSISNTSTSAIIGGSATSFVDGPLRKNINNGQSFTFPVGDGTRFGTFVLNNTSVASSPQYWTVEYVNSNPNPTYPTAPANLNSPVSDVSNNEYWVVNRPSGGTANVTLRWDANSYPAVTPDANLRNRLRVVEFEIATSLWSERGNVISGDATSGTVATSSPVTQNSYIFTLGLVGVTAGIITPPNTYSICDNGEQAAIQVALTGTAPWTLSYRTNGNSIIKNFTQTGISSSPFTIQLTSSDLGGYGTDPYTLSLISVSDASMSGIVNSTTVDITVKQTFVPSISGPLSVGTGQTHTYSTTNNAGSSYLWTWFGTSGGSISSPNSASTDITFNAGTGTFQLRLVETSASGCPATDMEGITVSPTPTPDINPKTANICINSSIVYSTTYNSGNEYYWTVTNGTCTGCDSWRSGSSAASITVDWTNTGDASIEVQERTPSMVIGTASQNYYVSPMPSNQTLSAADICYNQNGNVTLNSSELNVTYQLKLASDDSDVGLPVNGTGSAIDLPTGVLTSSTSYYVNASNEGCLLRIPSPTGTVTVVVNPNPTITLDGNPEVCRGITSTTMTYSATTGSPDKYDIDFDATSESQGFVDVSNENLSGGSIVITIPPNPTPASYYAELVVRNSLTGCVSGIYPFLVIVNPTPTITLSTFPVVCSGTTTANLPYTGTTNSPDLYNIDFDAIAELAGFSDVPNTALPSSPIVIDVPVAPSPSTYNANLRVTISSTGCYSSNYPITVTVNARPEITLGTNPEVCSGIATANLSYSATYGSPNEYSIDFDAIAEAEGFIDVPYTSLPASPININVPGGATPATYDATLLVRNTTTGCISNSYPIQITINSLPTITLGTNPTICYGITSAQLTYSATTGSPNRYSIDYDATAEGQGFSDVTNSILPVSPINLVVPGTAAADTYNGVLTVTNTTTTCSSNGYNISVTIYPKPAITLGSNPAVCRGVTTADLTYSNAIGAPDLYSIDYIGTANANGFSDITDSPLPASPIVLTIPPGASPITYLNNKLTVKYSSLGCVSDDYFFDVTVNPLPVVNAYADQTDVCWSSGLQINLGTDNGTNYSFSWTPADDLDNPNSRTPVFTPSNPSTPTQTTTFTVTVTITTTGCQDSDAVDVKINRQPVTGDMYTKPN